MFFVFFVYEKQKDSSLNVLRVVSPVEVVVDLNKNGIEDDNENIFIEGIQSFSVKHNKNQSELVKKLKISEEDAIGLGFLAENFAKETLDGKHVRVINKNLTVDNKNYKNLIVEKGFAVEFDKTPNKSFNQNLEKVRKLNFVIFNNKSHKYHKLNCKYGLMAHNSQVLPIFQVPKDAKPCKFCLVKQNDNKKYKKYHKIKYYNDEIPDVKSPLSTFQSGAVKIFLTDMTKVLRPTNNCSSNICKALVKEINSAQNSIDFAIYGYTKIPEIQFALSSADKRGVKIRFLYDLDKEGTNIYPDTKYLASIIPNNNHDCSNHLMHNKFFIFDNTKVFTGSANLSNTDMSGFNSNVMLLVDSPKVANIYEKEFEQMYGGKWHKQKSKIKNKDDDSIGIYFSPKDKPINIVISLIDSSQKYVYIPAFLITHKGLSDSLIRAHNRGVAVKVILDATSTHVGSSKMKSLRQSGIPVKTENFAGKLHSKSMIIDDLYTIIGSMNFSRSGDSENDENMLIIKNREIATFYKTFFQYLWAKIPDKWLKLNARAESPDSIGSCSDGIDNDFDGKIDKADESCRIIYKKKLK